MTPNSDQIEPAFDFGIEKSFTLRDSCTTEMTLDGTPYVGTSRVYLDLSKTSGVYAQTSFSNVAPKDRVYASNNWASMDSIRLNGHVVKGFIVSMPLPLFGDKVEFTWCPQSGLTNVIGVDRNDIAHIVFHLFSLEDILGPHHSTYRTKNSSIRIDHIQLLHDDLNIEIRSLPETRTTIKRLEQEGGHGLTHVGRIEHKSGKCLRSESVLSCLDSLRHFMTFALGRRYESVCPVGFDKAGVQIWEGWSSPLAQWGNRSSWFDPYHAEQLEQFYPSFMKFWQVPDWCQALIEIIHWYVISNDSGSSLNASIILTQTGLERLAFELVARDRKLEPVLNFKKRRASDRLRMLFGELEIPIEVPDELPALKKLALQESWDDGPHAITELRNSFVHPDHRLGRPDRQVLIETWKLGLWYLEMSLLATCGYEGTYGNRLKDRTKGQVESVPWT